MTRPRPIEVRGEYGDFFSDVHSMAVGRFLICKEACAVGLATISLGLPTSSKAWANWWVPVVRHITLPHGLDRVSYECIGRPTSATHIWRVAR